MTTTHSDVQTKEVHGYVLPTRPRPAGSLLVVPTREATNMGLHRRTGEVAQRLGERFLLLAECQQQFLGELRSGLRALEGAVVEDARIRLQASVRSAIAVLDWCDTLQADLLAEAQRAARGWQPIDLGEACREAATGVEGNGIAVLVSGQTAQPWWGDAGRLAVAIQAGLSVVAERTGGQGTIQVEVGGTSAQANVRIAGTGEPGEQVDSASVRAFRNAVERLGATVVPDALGPGGAGLILELPGSTN